MRRTTAACFRGIQGLEAIESALCCRNLVHSALSKGATSTATTTSFKKGSFFFQLTSVTLRSSPVPDRLLSPALRIVEGSYQLLFAAISYSTGSSKLEVGRSGEIHRRNWCSQNSFAGRTPQGFLFFFFLSRSRLP